MKKEELIAEVSRRTGIRQVQVSSVLENVLDVVVDTLGRNDEVVLRGFGTFKMKERKPKVMKNPTNGETYEIPRRSVAVFKNGSRLNNI